MGSSPGGAKAAKRRFPSEKTTKGKGTSKLSAGVALSPKIITGQKSGCRMDLREPLAGWVIVYCVTSSQLFCTFGTGSVTPNVAGRQVKLPVLLGNTSQIEPAPYQTVSVDLAGIVQVP